MTNLALVLAIGVAIPGSNTWEKIDDDDGILVWARAVPSSSVREVKARTIVDVAAQRLWDVIRDSRSYPEFMPYVKQCRILGEHPEGHFLYQLVDPPIIDRRDVVVKVFLEADKSAGRYRRRWEVANDRGPPPLEGTVRIRISRGEWNITRLGPKRTRMDYYLYVDPGGSLPAWIINRANTSSIPDVIEAVRKRALDPGWKK